MPAAVPEPLKPQPLEPAPLEPRPTNPPQRTEPDHAETLPVPPPRPTRRAPHSAASSTDGVRVRIPGTATPSDPQEPPTLTEPDLATLTSLTEHTTPPTPSPVPTTARGRPRAGDDIDPAARTPRSFHLSRQLLERARAAAYWVNKLCDTGEPTNISELVERALRREVERLEREYNDGQPFPAVQGRMRSGPGAAGVERIRRAQRLRKR